MGWIEIAKELFGEKFRRNTSILGSFIGAGIMAMFLANLNDERKKNKEVVNE